ncbi:hypothetical protein QK289_10740 [Exiguobacterium antarcticum]|uniref:Uncharacterized protein n=1 Tax=Exiguobacterium antarcticum TaxID=132920 RepID=A0ABT6R3F2_9BACL|nr:hypothetical protein [Exiguobacterium antarcticum]MDI3235485.1 hypothetical protein [Exiguobacterium antarcticum]
MLNIYLTLMAIPNLALAALIMGVVLTFKYGRLFVRQDIPASSKQIAAMLYGMCLFGLSGMIGLFS